MINNTTNSTRYRCCEETKNVLEYVHGGRDGSINGAWDYLISIASITEIVKFNIFL